MDEVLLSGGRTTKGVVRIGEYVHRPMNSNSLFVHECLRFLELSGCDFVPKFKGIDSKNREILTYMQGLVPEDLKHFDDETICKAASLIRKFHAYGKGEQQLIHNDLSPCNFVFVEGEPVAIIDFDACTYGDIWIDIGYAVWHWLNLGSDCYFKEEQKRRMTLFANSYGSIGLPKLIDSVIASQQLMLSKSIEPKHKKWTFQCLEWSLENLSDETLNSE